MPCQSASIGVRRIHMHQGLNYRYSSWQPIKTERTPIGTKPPYYGNVATAAMLGDLSQGNVQITSLKMPSEELDAGYAAYVDGKIARIAVINLRTHNDTGEAEDMAGRPEQTYVFHLPELDEDTEVKIDRLMAKGSNVLSGITYGGFSFNHELDEGRPVRLSNVTSGEIVSVNKDGLLRVSLPDASAAILDLGSA